MLIFKPGGVDSHVHIAEKAFMGAVSPTISRLVPYQLFAEEQPPFSPSRSSNGRKKSDLWLM